MTTLSQQRAESTPSSRLLIHADGAFDQRRRASDSPLTRLLTLYSGGEAHHDRANLRVQVHDLRGAELYAFEDADSLIDVELPEGTYHVTTQLGDIRRGYTMTLKAGEAFDLYLRVTGGALS